MVPPTPAELAGNEGTAGQKDRLPGLRSHKQAEAHGQPREADWVERATQWSQGDTRKRLWVRSRCRAWRRQGGLPRGTAGLGLWEGDESVPHRGK